MMQCELCGNSLSLYTPRGDGLPATWQCSKCALVQVRLDRREQELWHQLYTDNGRYHREHVLRDGFTFEARYAHDLELAEIRLQNLSRFVTEGRLLDVGASNGAFVKLASEYGFEAEGIEPDEWVVQKAKQLGVNGLFCGTFEDFCELAQVENYRVVSFFDSFEHLLHPWQALFGVRTLIADGGWLVMEMPDAESRGAKRKGRSWKHCRPDEHAYQYGRSHVSKLLALTGFELKDTIMPYPDRRSYYAQAKK